MTLFELRGVERVYGSGDGAVRAVAGIDLDITRGEFAVIAGPSGSGKTTLLQLLGALDRPTGGTIRFEGRDMSGLSDAELAALRRDRIGFVFQQFNLIPTLSAQLNVEAAMAPTSRSGAERRTRARDLLDRVGLGERGTHLPGELSGGEQQRVAIARALANEPDVLLADEPTGNLDTATGDAILRLMGELNEEQNLTVILITHDTSIAGAAPRKVKMRDGLVDSDSGSAIPA